MKKLRIIDIKCALNIDQVKAVMVKFPDAPAAIRVERPVGGWAERRDGRFNGETAGRPEGISFLPKSVIEVVK